VTKRSSRWSFQDYEVVHFDGGGIIYLIREKKKGKEKVRTWKKLRGKLMVSLWPPTYILKHVTQLSKKNDSKSSRIDVYFNKGSPKSSSTLSSHCAALEEIYVLRRQRGK